MVYDMTDAFGYTKNRLRHFRANHNYIHTPMRGRNTQVVYVKVLKMLLLEINSVSTEEQSMEVQRLGAHLYCGSHAAPRRNLGIFVARI